MQIRIKMIEWKIQLKKKVKPCAKTCKINSIVTTFLLHPYQGLQYETLSSHQNI